MPDMLPFAQFGRPQHRAIRRPESLAAAVGHKARPASWSADDWVDVPLRRLERDQRHIDPHLDGDPDGDPVDAAGMVGGTEDQGVGPGGDPERFGDLIEQ